MRAELEARRWWGWACEEWKVSLFVVPFVMHHGLFTVRMERSCRPGHLSSREEPEHLLWNWGCFWISQGDLVTKNVFIYKHVRKLELRGGGLGLQRKGNPGAQTSSWLRFHSLVPFNSFSQHMQFTLWYPAHVGFGWDYSPEFRIYDRANRHRREV